MMTEKNLEVLEYNKILQAAAAFVASAVTGVDFQKIRPANDSAEVSVLLQQVQEAYDVYHKDGLRPLTAFDDIAGILEKARISAILQIAELKKIARSLRAGRIAFRSIMLAPSAPQLLINIINQYAPEEALEKEIESALISDTEVSTNASSRLKEIRRKLAGINQKLKDKLSEYSRSSTVSKYLQDNLVTLRAGRYVLPVKSECRAQVPGLIHDRSATGSTLFIEPFAVVDMNNEIKALQMDEAAEIERILKELSQKVSGKCDNIYATQNSLILLDIVFAKMHYCVDLRCSRPYINTDGHINLLNSRHPLIDKDKVVPVTFSVGGEYRMLTITGPNTGGKTVCLKTAGLFCLMACSGFWIPADEGSTVAVFDSIYADIGDEQSITSSLSTFSSHIINIIGVVGSATRNSLLLFDELGAGTDPSEGAALAIGILKYLEKMGCTCIITTHYSELKEYALLSQNILNASMQFNETTLSPTYKLLMGLPGTSNALKIAQRLGMPQSILSEAYKSLPEKKLEFERLLSEAEKTRLQSLDELAKISQERAELNGLRRELVKDKEKLTARLESINANAKAEINRRIEKSAVRAEEIIEEIKEKLKEVSERADERALWDAKRLKRKLEESKFEEDPSDNPTIISYEEINLEELKKGDSVIIKSLGAAGIVLDIFESKGEAKIQAGAAIANIKFANLAKAAFVKSEKMHHGTQYPAKHRARLKSERAADSGNGVSASYAPVELDVRGLTVSEAIEAVEPHIECMSREGNGRILRVIHGKGTGALARGLRIYLKGNRLAQSFAYAGYGQGDTGVTIIEIRRDKGNL